MMLGNATVVAKFDIAIQKALVLALVQPRKVTQKHAVCWHMRVVVTRRQACGHISIACSCSSMHITPDHISA